jgi:hypothetical protein
MLGTWVQYMTIRIQQHQAEDGDNEENRVLDQ